jgi:hypothetical protein
MSEFTGRWVAAAAAAVMGAGALLVPSTAQAETWGNWYYLQGSINGGVAAYAQFGAVDDAVFIGDWDGDGKDTLMLRRDNVFYVTNSPTGGTTSYSFRYGSGGDVVIVGDWDGDGRDTVGVRRGNEYHLTNGTRGGAAAYVFRYGSGTDELVIGDWNADGRDTFGVRRSNQYYLTNTRGGVAQVVAKFGSGTDVVIVGDWNGDRKDTLGVRRANAYHLANAIVGGSTSVINTFGSAADTSFVGDWNGDGIDTMAVRRTEGPPRSFAGNGAFVVNSQIQPAVYKGSVASGSGCYWERVTDFSGDLDSVIANVFEDGPFAPLYVEIKGGDAGFVTEDCARWVEAKDSDAVSYLTIDDGQYRIGKDIEPGVYGAPGGADECYWERQSSFDGEFESVIANDFGGVDPIVEVSPSDVGFYTSGCGTWTKLEVAALADATRRVGPDGQAWEQRQQREATLTSATDR